jgi:SpoVK/Ycf46/Vps4 family AAA+-type ATPase
VHKFLKAHGVLTGEFVEKNALELKGEYVGSTTPLVKACFAEAKGGTLFLDEAYGLSADGFKNGGDSFSKEAVRTLLTEVENNRTGTVVILAGCVQPYPVPITRTTSISSANSLHSHTGTRTR